MYIPVLAANAALSQMYQQMKPAMILLAIILGVLIAASIAFTLTAAQIKTNKRQRRTQHAILRLMYLATCVVFICTLVCFIRYRSIGNKLMDAGGNSPSTSTNGENNVDSTDDSRQDPTEPTESVPQPTFTPGLTELSDPQKWGIQWEIIKNGAIVDSYQATESISFGKPDDYFALPGIATFRGNNFRNSATYGTADVQLRTLDKAWSSNNVGS